jgi:hypothetical protein
VPLPTTVTTAKQTAAKAAKTRRANTELQASSPPPTNAVIPKPTPAHIPDLTDAQISAELLDHFQALGMTRQQIRAVASTWLITQAELQHWETKLDHADTLERARIDRETAKLAAQMEACILQHGQVKTMAIRNASPERLLQFTDYYEAELDDLYPTLTTAQDDTPEQAELRATWDRLNTYLWECKQATGSNAVTLQAYTGQNLEAELDQALGRTDTP